MARKNIIKAETRTIVLLDAVNFTQELKTYGRPVIAPKVNQLKEFGEFFFVFKLKGELIGQLGDGFLILCPPTPAEVINEAVACQAFIEGYNHGKTEPAILNVRIAIHFGLIAPPEEGNYIDTNLNLTSRLEGATPLNCICISSVLYQIVADVLRGYKFEELKSEFKGLGQNQFYVISNPSDKTLEPTRRESRLSFYFSTIDTLRGAEEWEAVKDTCRQGLADFPDNPEITSQLAFAFLELEEYQDSISAYELCVQMNYDISQSLYLMGCAYDRLGDEERAIMSFREAIKRNPRHFHSMAFISGIILSRGDVVEAGKWAKRALKYNPAFLTPRSILIVIALVKKEYDSIPALIERIETHRLDYLQRITEEVLDSMSIKGHKKRLTVAFESARKEPIEQ
jgi:tetratricopeptide (TPR) repeat protein